MRSTGELLQPPKRGPVDATKATPEDPPPPSLRNDVIALSDATPLNRVQAQNRLRQAGVRGTLAVADFIAKDRGDPVRRREAAQFLCDISVQEFSELSQVQGEEVRAAVALGLDDPDVELRALCARVLQVHGPGSQRTRMLAAIADPERKVRWAVVRRFGQNPAELDSTQRRYLITFLEADSREEFASLDSDSDGQLTPNEFKEGPGAFQALDQDGDGSISLSEWVSPVPDSIRADVMALLQQLHAKLTPELEPPGYNPYAPAADQLDAKRQWSEWVDRLK